MESRFEVDPGRGVPYRERRSPALYDVAGRSSTNDFGVNRDLLGKKELFGRSKAAVLTVGRFGAGRKISSVHCSISFSRSRLLIAF